ncbi:PorT family protein [Marivirga sp. S37H4]|uniref:PorT family protein n=1 Tax=Marivirga aurantiaca TaxID=2802615 RepID=A0A934X014_9BACT|nr:porin family protein [Marivirga aurantiaca]MBK6266369.1 PorT family protein [Marivirga aurantiaca]
MKFKIIVLSLSIVLIGLHSAQAQTSFGIVGGVNFQNLNGTDSDGDKLDNDLIVGFHAGVNLLIPVAPDFYFSPGLLFSVKGASDEAIGIVGSYRINYLELPLNLVYKAKVGNGHILLGFGPYVGYAVGGKAKFEGDNDSYERDIVFQNTIESGDDPEFYLKRFDAGANIFFGYELEAGLFLQLNTQLGLLNIHPEDKRVNDDESVVKNTGFGISVGFRF